MKKPSIIQYLLSTCLLTIDELNERYSKLPKNELKVVADTLFNEMDITVRLGYPFREMVHYTIGDGSKKGIKVNHDLYVASKEFKVEIKYLRSFYSEVGTPTNRLPWSPVQKDFDWIVEELQQGNKGKTAFVVGWFNCGDCFASGIQLGKTKGKNPEAYPERIAYFPFLNKVPGIAHINDLSYDYDCAYETLTIDLPNVEISNLNCMFLGNETDVFHFAIYY